MAIHLSELYLIGHDIHFRTLVHFKLSFENTCYSLTPNLSGSGLSAFTGCFLTDYLLGWDYTLELDLTDLNKLSWILKRKLGVLNKQCFFSFDYC